MNIGNQTMAGFWNDCVEAASDAFEISRTTATLFVIGLFTWMGVMILKTWFIWAGLIAIVLTVYALLLTLEYILRAWYAIRHGLHLTGPANPYPPDAPAVSVRPTKPCADVQGRIKEPDLQGYNVNMMAERILREAVVWKAPKLGPFSLSFPAIGLAWPRLARAGQIVKVMLVR